MDARLLYTTINGGLDQIALVVVTTICYVTITRFGCNHERFLDQIPLYMSVADDSSDHVDICRNIDARMLSTIPAKPVGACARQRLLAVASENGLDGLRSRRENSVRFVRKARALYAKMCHECKDMRGGDDMSININQLCYIAHKNAVDKGFYNNTKFSPTEKLAKLMLIVSECAEACEDIRDNQLIETISSEGKPVGLPSELADIAIRLFDLCGWLEIDLEGAIERKMGYNKSRQFMHGKVS